MTPSGTFFYQVDLIPFLFQELVGMMEHFFSSPGFNFFGILKMTCHGLPGSPLSLIVSRILFPGSQKSFPGSKESFFGSQKSFPNSQESFLGYRKLFTSYQESFF